MAAESIALAFSVLTFAVFYLATNTSEEHIHLQLLNYLLGYIMIAVTGYLSYGAITSESTADLAGLVTGFNNGFAFVLYLVFAYFGIWLIRKVLKSMGEKA